MQIKMKAKSELNFPQSKRSGAKINSMVFIMAITIICIRVFKRGSKFVRIQILMQISEMPINTVNKRACSSPKILATICWWRGTRSRTLQRNPFANHTKAKQNLNIVCSLLEEVSKTKVKVQKNRGQCKLCIDLILCSIRTFNDDQLTQIRKPNH